MGKMKTEIKDNKAFQFALAKWHFPNKKRKYFQQIDTSIDNIFDKLIIESNVNRGTYEVYARIRKRIFKECPATFYHEVERKELLSEIYRFYYGHHRFWPSIYNVEENKKKIGKDPDYITPEQRLLIPRNPKMPKK